MRANGVPQGDLVDTGAILALADPTDSWHAACCDVFTTQVRLPLVTTAAVLTEAFYFAVKQGFRRQVWSLVHSSMVVVPITNQELPALDTLMDRYAPMDFADATLVRVAEREGLKTILTIDHADFETYRIGRNAKFRILPAR